MKCVSHVNLLEMLVPGALRNKFAKLLYLNGAVTLSIALDIRLRIPYSCTCTNMDEESTKPLVEGFGLSRAKSKGSFRRWLKRIVLCLVLLFIAAIGLSALSNLILPSCSSTIEQLSDLDKARLMEVLNLRMTLGDTIWPGWGSATIPVIQYNEQYAFLVNYDTPPAGWLKVPQQQQRGGPWEPVPGDTFDDGIYYRQFLTDPNIRPEAFTVLIGECWVASMTTKQWTQISLGNEMRKDLPGIFKHIVPYRLFGQLLNSDWHICCVLHESFHAYQGITAPERLAEAETCMSVAVRYPWDEPMFANAWQKELNLLADALLAPLRIETASLARKFLAQRQQRRDIHGLEADLVDFERQREWEEGLAKYVELAVWRLASTTPDYQPVAAMSADRDFKHYKGFTKHWSQEVAQLRRSSQSRDSRFYYTGMAQAFLLDRLVPDWKTKAMTADTFLEGLLLQALSIAN